MARTPSPTLHIVHCLTGERHAFPRLPVTLLPDGPVDGLQPSAEGVSFRPRPDGCWLVPGDAATLVLDGAPLTANRALAAGSTGALLVRDAPFAVTLGGEPPQPAGAWRVFAAAGSAPAGSAPFEELPALVRRLGLDPATATACPGGIDASFPLAGLAGRFPPGALGAPAQALPPLPPHAPPDPFSGELTCPNCWLRFERGNVLSIAAHESLRGDPVLGDDAKRRFLPRRFSADGMPLDAAGLPCPEMACPHCRRRLPHGFLQVPSHIVSVVGAPGAGKSYFLSVLIKVLPATLLRAFGVVFRDEDPTNNVLLNEMKQQLFAAEKREDALLGKTVLEGRTYEWLPRFGKRVALPRPFVYGMSRRDGAGACALVFYDNAGEHFQANVNLDESPGALHVAASSAILFLFDPASHPGFRRRLAGHPDPQLALRTQRDQQDLLLSEMEVRIKRLRGLDPSRQVETPLLVVIGKCDIWRHLIDAGALRPAIRDGRLDQAAVDANSALLRDFLLEIDPSIVANAEALSANVRFFAASALGHSPERIEGGQFDGYLAPDPNRLRPIDVDVPVLWALARVAPHLVPPL